MHAFMHMHVVMRMQKEFFSRAPLKLKILKYSSCLSVLPKYKLYASNPLINGDKLDFDSEPKFAVFKLSIGTCKPNQIKVVTGAAASEGIFLTLGKFRGGGCITTNKRVNKFSPNSRVPRMRRLFREFNS